MTRAMSVRMSVITVADGTFTDRILSTIDAVAAVAGAELVIAVADPSSVELAHDGGATTRAVDAVGLGRAAALEVAERASVGEILVWLDPAAALQPHALERLSAAIARGADVAYGDHVVDADTPLAAFKPEFSPERLRSHDYISPVVMATRTLVERAAARSSDVDGAELHDLALRLTEVAAQVERVPHIVARMSPPVVADDAHRRAVVAHCDRVDIRAEVETTGESGVVRVVRHIDERPLVSVIIPTRGMRGVVTGEDRSFVVEAVRSLCDRSTYHDLEFVVVHDTETPAPAVHELRQIAGDRLVLAEFDAPFNFSAKINAGVAASSGQLLLILNDDTQLIEPSSLDVMVAHLQHPDVGMVGAKLLFEDGTLQHGGHVYHHKIHHACLGWPGDSPGPHPLTPLVVERECSGVTAAAAMVRRDTFDEVGGFDERYPLNYNDVDFSLRLREAGHRIIWTPHASWFHYESRTRDSTLRPDEIERIEAQWGHRLRHDPYYHPELSPDTGDWSPVVPTPVTAVSTSDRDSSTWLASVRERAVSAVLGPPPARPRGVNLVGYLDATSGLGERVRQLARVLDVAGVRCSHWNLDLTDSARGGDGGGADNVRTDDGVVFDTTIAVVTALAFPGIEGVFPSLVRDVDRLIGYWFWELEQIPETHRAAIDLVDEIWAPTRFVRDAYATAVDLPVELVPLPVARPQPSDADRTTFGFQSTEFVFLTSFDHLSSMQRKNPAGAIAAFRAAFPAGDERVRLVVKSINGHLRPVEHERLARLAADDDRIELRDGRLDTADLAALIGSVDALVSLHRSEGLGLHIAEAMWLETPVIATAYSGSLDLTAGTTDGAVAFEVGAALVPVVDGGEAYRMGRWAEPDLDQAVRAMQQVVAGGPEVAARVRRALDRMGRQADMLVAANIVLDVLRRRDRPPTRRERVAGLVRSAQTKIRSATRIVKGT